ncbi:hypothetical protein PMAYCL1PPCAC_17282, partial [Pristionchus mayeri]
LRRQADMRQRFPVGSAVWCLWDGGKEYAARVMKHDEKRGEFRYYVHFTGWNSRHDDWVAESQLRINKNPVLESPGQGPVQYSGRYSPEPESSKKKNGKKRKEERSPEDRKGRKEEKELIVAKEKMDHKSSKRKVEILSDIPAPPTKRSKAARMKYSPPPKPVTPTAARSRGRPPKHPPAAAAAVPSTSAGPSTSEVEKHSSSKHKSRYERYEEDENATSAHTDSNRVLSPSTVRRRKKTTAAANGLEIDEAGRRDGMRTPQDTHPPDMGSPTSAVLSLAIDLFLDYGGRLKSPEGRPRRNLTAENKKEVIASLVENFKRDEKALAEERKRRWRHYLEFKKRLVKDFEQYLNPADNSKSSEALSVQQSATAGTSNEGGENGVERKEEREVKMEEEKVKERKEEEMMEENEVHKEEKEQPGMRAVKEEVKSEVMEGKMEEGSPTEATTASPTDESPRPSVPTASSSSATAEVAANPLVEQSQLPHAPASAATSPQGGSVVASKTSPLTLTMPTSSGTISAGGTPLPSPALPPSLKPNPNVPAEQSYAHIPFVGAETARDVVSQMKAEKAHQQGRGGGYMAKNVPQKSYLMAGNSVRSVGPMSSGTRVMGRQNTFVSSFPNGGSGKPPLLVQSKKMMHDSDGMYQHGHHRYYGGPSTSTGRGMNGGMKREYYSPMDSIEYMDDFSQGVVAEEVVVSDDMMEVDANEPGPSSRAYQQSAHSLESRADHCYGPTSAAKSRQNEQHFASREYSAAGPGGATVVSAASMAGGGPAIRQRLVMPRQYANVSSGGPLLPPSSSGVRSMVSVPSGGTSTTGGPVYMVPQGGNGMVSRTFRFRPAPGAPPVLHAGVGGAGQNVRLVDSRRMRPVYVRTNGMTTGGGGGAQPYTVAPTRVTPVGGGMNGGGGGNGMRRVAYIAPPVRTTRIIVPKVAGGGGGVTMAAARGADAATAAAAAEVPVNNEPPILVPEMNVTEQQPQ